MSHYETCSQQIRKTFHLIPVPIVFNAKKCYDVKVRHVMNPPYFTQLLPPCIAVWRYCYWYSTMGHHKSFNNIFWSNYNISLSASCESPLEIGTRGLSAYTARSSFKLFSIATNACTWMLAKQGERRIKKVIKGIHLLQFAQHIHLLFWAKDHFHLNKRSDSLISR